MASDGKLLRQCEIIADIGVGAYTASMDYRRTSPQQGTREFFIAVAGSHAPLPRSSLVATTGEVFQCIQDWVPLTPHTADHGRCVVLDKSSAEKCSLFVVSSTLERVRHRSFPPHEARVRVELVAETAPASSLELSRDKKRLYLLDPVRERVEVRCTANWLLLASGPIQRV
jgi:hypothetical protein